MNWGAFLREEEELFALLQKARALSEEGGGRLLAASACLDILSVAFKYDRCAELMQVMGDYARSKVKED